jgi:hypothetical protein
MSKRATDPSRYSAMNVTRSVSFLFASVDALFYTIHPSSRALALAAFQARA